MKIRTFSVSRGITVISGVTALALLVLDLDPAAVALAAGRPAASQSDSKRRATSGSQRSLAVDVGYSGVAANATSGGGGTAHSQPAPEARRRASMIRRVRPAEFRGDAEEAGEQREPVGNVMPRTASTSLLQRTQTAADYCCTAGEIQVANFPYSERGGDRAHSTAVWYRR